VLLVHRLLIPVDSMLWQSSVSQDLQLPDADAEGLDISITC
jgi:hypothetical protein